MSLRRCTRARLLLAVIHFLRGIKLFGVQQAVYRRAWIVRFLQRAFSVSTSNEPLDSHKAFSFVPSRLDTELGLGGYFCAD